MAKKAKCFIQISGEMKGLHGKNIPAMRDWIALLPDPVELVEVSIEAMKFCQREKITGGEVVHFQKIGAVEDND